MEISQVLLHASQLVYENVKDMAGTDDAAGDLVQVQVVIFLVILT